MNTKTLCLIALIFAVGIVFSITAIADESTPAKSGANVNISPELQALAKNPTPPADAKKNTSVGDSVSATMSSKNTTSDSDSVWVQEIDVDGDGNIEKTNLLWDDEDRVLFISYKDDFTCNNGNPGSGAILIGLNAEGNARKRPVGSGFYTVSLDKSECGSESAALFGCKFDAKGNETACGVAVLDEKNDDLTIATVSQN